MRSRPPTLAALIIAGACLRGQPQLPSFEAASVKPSSPGATAISCHGGPGTTDPGMWACTNTPLGLVISQAYEFQRYQFRPNDPCCLNRFDFTAKVPAGTSTYDFHRMMQSLLEDRFKLKLHYEKKEMPIYRLVVTEGGSKLTPTAPGDHLEPEDPWSPPQYAIGKDGYPIIPPGHAGIAGATGHYIWRASDLSMSEIAQILAYYSGRPVVDATRLTGKYTVSLKWWIDIAWAIEQAGYRDMLDDLPDQGKPGPPLMRAIQDQLGLKLIADKGLADIVAVDHFERIPAGN